MKKMRDKAETDNGRMYGSKKGEQMCVKKAKFKRGAASYYIVAFSTLILVIIATSFATVILSEMTRSMNDDLSQSAYDSALAGVEDAKLAFSNYQRCVAQGKTASATKPSGNGTVTCEDIIYWMEHPDCYMVGHILGRIGKSEDTEVAVGATITTNGQTENVMNQAYTCVQINTKLSDYVATLSGENARQTMRAQVGTGQVSPVEKIRISWFTAKSDTETNFGNVALSGDTVERVQFTKARTNKMVVPPTVELQIVQTGVSFNMADFDKYAPAQANRMTMYLVPTDENKNTVNNKNYVPANNNVITAAEAAKTNSRTVSNKPFVVKCKGNNASSDFLCSVEVVLPGVFGQGAQGETRSNETLMVSVALPYGQPDTDFKIELICNTSNSGCGQYAVDAGSSGDSTMTITNTQISVDSTGRANDLYRRVETRLEASDTAFGGAYPYYALQVYGDEGIEKNMTVTSEYNFYF